MNEIILSAIVIVGYLLLIGGAIFVAVHMIGFFLAVLGVLLIVAVAYMGITAVIYWWKEHFG